MINPIVPKTISEAKELAKTYLTSDVIRNALKTVGNIYVAIDISLALGIHPAMGVRSICLIRNKFCVPSEMLLALARRTGFLESLEERIDGDLEAGTAVAVCVIKRKDEEPKTYTFSTEDAKRAKLWKYKVKSSDFGGPWATYPTRMLKIRAMTFAIRDTFADCLQGLTSVEEARDIPKEPVSKKSEIKELKLNANVVPMIPEDNNTDVENMDGLPGIPPPFSKVLKRSHLVRELFVTTDDGSVHWGSGVIYTPDEAEKVKAMKKLQNRKKYYLEKVKLIKKGAENECTKILASLEG